MSQKAMSIFSAKCFSSLARAENYRSSEFDSGENFMSVSGSAVIG
jgi:hypothetical protein